jgi:hypothetical protein
MSPDNMIRLQELRNKSRAGEATPDDLKEALRLMREDRTSAAVTSAAKRERTSASAAQVDTGSLLSQLMGS